MGYIYCITNTENNKKYIGQTSRTIQRRFNEHCRHASCVSSPCYNYPLEQAIRKYGKDKFSISLIEETDNLDEREIYWIRELNTYLSNTGYNATEGGNHYYIPNEVVSTLIELYNSGKTIEEIHEEYQEYSIKSLTHFILGKSGYFVYKKIFQYTLEGNFIQEFNGLEAVRKWILEQKLTDCQECDRFIFNVLKGIKPTAYGFQWSWEYNESINKAENTRKTKAQSKIIQFSKNGESLQEFDSFILAAKWLIDNNYTKGCEKGVAAHINKCCNGKLKTAYKYIWKFKDN